MLLTVACGSDLNELLRNGSRLRIFPGFIERQAALLHLLELRWPLLSNRGQKMHDEEKPRQKAGAQPRNTRSHPRPLHLAEA